MTYRGIVEYYISQPKLKCMSYSVSKKRQPSIARIKLSEFDICTRTVLLQETARCQCKFRSIRSVQAVVLLWYKRLLIWPRLHA